MEGGQQLLPGHLGEIGTNVQRPTALAAALGAVDDEARWAVVELGAVFEDHG